MVRAVPVLLVCSGFLGLLAVPLPARAQLPTTPPPALPPTWNGAPQLPYAIGVPQQGTPAVSPPSGPPVGVPPTAPLPTWQQPVGPIPPPPVLPYATPPGGVPEVTLVNQKAGWFSAFEVGLVAPEIHGQLSAPVTVGGVSRTVSLPFNNLDWTGSPRFELGYRFGQDLGAVVGTYRSLVSSGSANLDGFDPLGPAHLHSRLNLNSLDLDYASMDLPVAPFWDLRWDLGVRVGGVFYDTRAAGQILEQRTSNNFVGAGPHAAVALYRQIDELPGFSMYGRLDGAVVIGQDSQSFEETNSLNGNVLLGGATRLHQTQTAPVLGLELGLTYAPQRNPHWLRFTFGYQFEQWWGVGGAGGSSGDLRFQGLFFRGEFNY